MYPPFCKSHLHFISINLLLLAGIVLGILGLTGYNLLSRSAKAVGTPDLSRIIYIMMGIAALNYIYFFYNKSVFLPHTAATKFPTKLITLIEPTDFDQDIELSVPNDTLYVVYWLSDDSSYAATKTEDNAENKGKIAHLRYKTPKNSNVMIQYRLVKADNQLSEQFTHNL
jgi:uncharacterized membrane protein YuzA (DUF378 family)